MVKQEGCGIGVVWYGKYGVASVVQQVWYIKCGMASMVQQDGW